MKRKKNEHTNETENINQWRKSFLLGKRQDARTKLKEDEEIKRREIFEQKTAAAADKKAPVTLRTRAYYRFSKEYPSTVDENGCRDNSRSKRAVKKRRIITLIICIAVFSATYIFANAFHLISEIPVRKAPATETDGETVTFRALHFSYDELKTADVNAMDEKLKAADCNAAVFEFKNDKGYVIFNTGSFMGMSADKRIPDAYDTVKQLHTLGYKTCAYISCFKDSAASASDLTYSVRNNSSEGGAWLDNSGYGWLDPFSDNAREYVLNIIKCAADKGFDRIILGNVCFSSDSGSAQQCYAWEEASQQTRNQILVNFIGSAVKNSGKAKLTVLCDFDALDTGANENTEKYYGNFLSCNASSFCVDARLTTRGKNITIGENSFSDASLMPYVFVLAVAEYTVNSVNETNDNPPEIIVCVENNSKLRDELEAVYYSGATGYIIW